MFGCLVYKAVLANMYSGVFLGIASEVPVTISLGHGGSWGSEKIDFLREIKLLKFFREIDYVPKFCLEQ